MKSAYKFDFQKGEFVFENKDAVVLTGYDALIMDFMNSSSFSTAIFACLLMSSKTDSCKSLASMVWDVQAVLPNTR